jgi:energy-coupling factor transporter transmembrane protein EcfT
VVALLRPDPGVLGRRALLALPLLVALVAPLLLVGDAQRGLALSARACSSLLTALAFASTFRPAELPPALAALGLPRTLVRLLGSMLRQAGAVSSQARRIVLARRLRGARGRQVSAEVLASLLAKTAERAERVELAMRLRGAGLGEASAQRRLGAGDLPALGASAAAAVAIHLAAR